MNVVVLTGSPHRNGTTALLAERLINGLMDAHHDIYRFDAAFESVHCCIGCNRCGSGKAPCVFRDAMLDLNQKLLASDLVVFVTPLYYHDVSAQLKTVIDRFHGIDSLLHSKCRKSMLITASARSDFAVMRGLIAHYETSMDYLQWKDCGQLFALGCETREQLLATKYPEEAYRMGNSIQS